MERTQEEMKNLGVFGVYREGHKVMAAKRKIFNQITLAFMLPLTFIYLAEMVISEILFSKNPSNIGSKSYTDGNLLVYILFNLAYYTIFLILSLLSTSAVVYSISCIYANRDITFRKVIGVVPQVWKRLMITFIVIYVFTFVYVVVAVFTLNLCAAIGGTAPIVILFILLIIYIIGFVYLTIVWQLASIVTVLEDYRGVKAIKKSRKLIKGKFWVALAILIELNILVVVIQVVFYAFVVYGNNNLEIWARVLVGIACLVLLVPIFLYQLVLQTIIYFVCKSYHNETIDKPAMSNHLGVYERLSAPNEVQMEQV